MNRFQFVEDHKDAWSVKRLCEVVEIARSSFYAWLAAAPQRAARVAADAALAARIRALQDPQQGGDRASGAPRITADLNEDAPADERVNHKRVARVMRQHGLAGIRLRKRVKTTVPDQSDRKFPDLVGRDFTAGEPGRRYVGDITYLPIADGTNLYLASCIDLGSRKLAGWSMAGHMRTELVEDALRTARRERGTLRGAIFHSDQGLHLEVVRNSLRAARGDPVDGRDRLVRGQRLGRIVQRGSQARAARGSPRVPRPGHGLPGCVPVGEPLQHPPPPLRDRQHRPERLRDRCVRYAPGSGITETTPCPRPGVKTHPTAGPCWSVASLSAKGRLHQMKDFLVGPTPARNSPSGQEWLGRRAGM